MSRWIIALILMLGLPLQAQAAPDVGVTTPPAPPAAAEASAPQAPVKISIVPHRAVYKMALGSVRNGSNISDVTGEMKFEWADTCDGWAVQQHMELHFAYAEGDETDVSSAVITWESKDGKRYNFNVRRITNGKETENYRGKASLDNKGGIGKYAIPADKKDVKLTADALFPSAHTTLILNKAASGEKLFTKMVFDGSDEDGAADVSAFIGTREESADAPEISQSLRTNTLLLQPSWPVRLAFFKLKSETGEPDYEMNLNLLPNGVARSMKIDYGDFSVTGVLSQIEALPPSGC